MVHTASPYAFEFHCFGLATCSYLFNPALCVTPGEEILARWIVVVDVIIGAFRVTKSTGLGIGLGCYPPSNIPNAYRIPARIQDTPDPKVLRKSFDLG